MNDFLTLFIVAAIVGITFAILWRKGFLAKITAYVAETREELKKCTWPSKEELRGSTVVVLVTIALLGGFTVGVDFVLSIVMRIIT